MNAAHNVVLRVVCCTHFGDFLDDFELVPGQIQDAETVREAHSDVVLIFCQVSDCQAVRVVGVEEHESRRAGANFAVILKLISQVPIIKLFDDALEVEEAVLVETRRVFELLELADFDNVDG